MVKDALKIVQRDGDQVYSSPILSFADDVVLESESEVTTAIALRAAVNWETRAGMDFNLGAKKIGTLMSKGRGRAGAGVKMGGEPVLGSDQEKYLGVTVASQDSTDASALDKKGKARDFARSY